MRGNWPDEKSYKAWVVAAGKPEMHVDRFEWKSVKTPNAVDRIAAWGPMGGVLSKRMLPCERPIVELAQACRPLAVKGLLGVGGGQRLPLPRRPASTRPQDETCLRQYDCQKKAWREDGVARSIAPKGEGAAVMLTGLGFVLKTLCYKASTGSSARSPRASPAEAKPGDRARKGRLRTHAGSRSGRATPTHPRMPTRTACLRRGAPLTPRLHREE